MKLMNIDVNKLDELFAIIDSCKGRVELVSEEGDRINMKSKLSQVVSLANIFAAGSDVINQLELVAYEPEDTAKLFDFMMGR